MKDCERFVELLTNAAAEYSYEASDTDFECIVKITCEGGWSKATIVELL